MGGDRQWWIVEIAVDRSHREAEALVGGKRNGVRFIAGVGVQLVVSGDVGDGLCVGQQLEVEHIIDRKGRSDQVLIGRWGSADEFLALILDRSRRSASCLGVLMAVQPMPPP